MRGSKHVTRLGDYPGYALWIEGIDRCTIAFEVADWLIADTARRFEKGRFAMGPESVVRFLFAMSQR
jgi:hypothetical protein